MNTSDVEARASQGNVRSVMLALQILEALADNEEDMGVTQLARQLGTTKARVFRHLQTLRRLGYVQQNKTTERNGVGPRLYLLGRLVGERFTVVNAIRPAMEALRDASGQTTVFSNIIDEQVTILNLLRGTNQVEIGLKLGSTFPLHATAQGKIALAFGAPGVRASYLEGRLERFTDHTIVDADALRRELDSVRAQGWAMAPQETIIGINALAAPVYGHDGIAGAIAIVGSIQFIPAQPLPQQLAALSESAGMASEALGWRGERAVAGSR